MWTVNFLMFQLVLEKAEEPEIKLPTSKGSLMEKEIAPHCSTRAWKIPWMEEPGGLQSMGLLRVRHDWATSLSHFPFMHWRRKWQPTPVFLPEESQGRGSLVGCPSMGSHRVGHDWSDLAAAAGDHWKSKSYRKVSTSALLVTPKPLTVCLTTNCGKLFKRQEYQSTSPASWEIRMQVKIQQLEPDMEQQTGSKSRK